MLSVAHRAAESAPPVGMNMNLILLGLMSGAAFSLGVFTGPEPRDMSTNKPTAEQCASATRDGRNLLGCAAPGAMIPASSNASPPRQPQPPVNRPRDPR